MNARPTGQGKPRRQTGKFRRRKHPREGHGPPLQSGGKCCGQPGNHDPRVIANPCRGRFYIGPVCGAANTPGGYLRPKSRTCGLWPPKRACGRSGIRPYMMGKCGGCFRGRHFVAGQSLRPRLAARPPPFDKGGKWHGGARSQPPAAIPHS